MPHHIVRYCCYFCVLQVLVSFQRLHLWTSKGLYTNHQSVYSLYCSTNHFQSVQLLSSSSSSSSSSVVQCQYDVSISLPYYLHNYFFCICFRCWMTTLHSATSYCHCLLICSNIVHLHSGMPVTRSHRITRYGYWSLTSDNAGLWLYLSYCTRLHSAICALIRACMCYIVSDFLSDNMFPLLNCDRNFNARN